MNKVDLSINNFISYFALHPCSERLSKKDQKIASIATGFMLIAGGSLHAICAIVWGVQSCKIAAKVSNVGQEKLNTKKSKEDSLSQDLDVPDHIDSSSSEEAIPEILKVPIDGALSNFEEKIKQCFSYYRNKEYRFKNFLGILITITIGSESHSFAQYFSKGGSLDKAQAMIPPFIDEAYRLLINQPGDQYHMEIKMWGKKEKDIYGTIRTLKTTLSQKENEEKEDGEYVIEEGKDIEFSTFTPKELPNQLLSEESVIQ